ncbi:hypothetical protein SAMN04489713_1186 [Actinomadura madurae]|uniref:Crocagin biosynthetic protein CgnE/B domain-containing protein n=1 Tax=Actinomadura madurae TaxID=1993 RepID=A0A1I5TIB6_9ACTN|nr:hypothetical protein [Actinomadura madurae]SFP82783.1 hypothetical protein SAMN04489713_1186 [Actinomadura madurae]
MTTTTARDGLLRQLFPEGGIVAVADDAELGRAAAERGLTYVPLDRAEELPAGASVVLLLQHHMVSKRIRLVFRHHSVLVVPIASFDGSPGAARYTLEMALRTDWVRAADTASSWIGKLREGAEQVVFGPEVAGTGAGDGDDTRLVCSLGGALTVDAWPRAAIGPGDWVSVGSCCELSITKRPGQSGADTFSMDGTAIASGVLAACDPRCTEAGRERFETARRLRAEMAGLGAVRLEMTDNVLTRVTAGGRDFTRDLLGATNPDHGLQALELGIGTNLGVLPAVDWRVNSQLNEGAGVLHIGFGEGITGAHMDFVVPHCEHHFR